MIHLTFFLLGAIAAELIRRITFGDWPQRRPQSRTEQRYTEQRRWEDVK